MPVHSASALLGSVDNTSLTVAAVSAASAYALKVWSGGRRCTWERDWAGKLIMVVAPPTSTTLSLLHNLSHLPNPPQILYLPPLESPLPDSLLTILHTIRLSAASNPLAQLHCEPLPPTPSAVTDFARKWATVPYGTAGEGGRRVDAIVLGGAWEVETASTMAADFGRDGDGDTDVKAVKRWTAHEYHFHLVTALLPTLLRTPAERNIRIISLVSPAWAAAIPGLKKGGPARSGVGVGGRGALHDSAKRGIQSLLVVAHLRLVLDTLASAAFGSKTKADAVVPDPNDPRRSRKRDQAVQSNILALAVVMPWTRDEVVRAMICGVDGGGSWLRLILWILFYPLITIFTPSPSKAIQSILFALSAPVKYANGDTASASVGSSVANDNKATAVNTIDGANPRRNGVRQGDVVRDCGIIDLPPVLSDPVLARATYESIEKHVEKSVKDSALREKAFPSATTATTQVPTH